MEYTQLLSRPEWGRKCNEILQRDQFVCKNRNCGAHGYHNDNFMSFGSMADLDDYLGKEFFASKSISDIFSLELSSLMNDDFTDVKLRHIMDFEDSSLYGFILLKSKANNKIFTNILNTPRGLRIISSLSDLTAINCKVYCFPERKVIQNEHTINYGTIIKFEEQLSENPILFVSKSTDYSIELEHGMYQNMTTVKYNVLYKDKLFHAEKYQEALTKKGLNIHHKYYVRGLMPWDYPNDALVTLCQDCHSSIHKQPVRIYDTIDKKDYKLATICDRCGGSGYLPQYQHVENGICFMCGGEGALID